MDQVQGWTGEADVAPGPVAAAPSPAAPELARHQLEAFDLLDEPCYVVDLGSEGVVWTNEAARAFWGAHGVAGLAVGAGCVAGLRQVDVEASRNVTLFCDGRLRTVACHVRPIRFEGGHAALLRVVTAGHPRPEAAPPADSEQPFRDFAEAASDWFWETDPGGRFTYVSPSITAATGERPEDLIGRTRQEMAKASGRPEAMAEVEPILKACARCEPFAGVVLGRPGPDGKPGYVATSGRPRFDAAGNFLGYRGAGRNITAQVETERRLAVSEQRFRDFAEVSSDWFWEQDEHLRFTFLSPGFQRITGEAPENLYGMTRRESGPLDVGDEQWAWHDAALAQRRPFADFRYSRIDRCGRKRTMVVSGRPIFEDGRFRGYRGTGRDISALVEAEHSLHQMIDSVPAVINLTDLDHRYVRANAYFARLCGEPRELVEGQPLGTYSGTAAVERARTANQRVIDTGEPSGAYEAPYRLRDGSERDYLVQKVAMRDAVGHVTGVLTVGMEITALKQAQKELEAARARLQASEQRFRDFAETASDWFWELDSDLRFSFISPQAQACTGEASADLIGRRPMRENVVGVSQSIWSAHIDALEAHRAIFDFRFAKQAPDGSLRHLSVSAKPVFDEHGVFQGYRGTGRDLTAQIEAEQFLRQVVDSTPAVIAVRDVNMRYRLLNDYYAKILGTTPEAGIGQPTGAFLGPERAAQATARDRQVIATGRPIGPYDVAMPDAGGELRQYLVNKVPLRSDADQVWAVLTVGIDVTAVKQAQSELMRAQERLGASERRFRDFAEIASDVTWEMGPDLRFTYISDSIEAITGLPPSAYLGKRNIDLEPDDPRRAELQHLLEQRRAIRDHGHSRQGRDGRVVYLMHSAKPIFGGDGAFLGYRGTIHDITAQREAEIETDRLRKVRDLAAAADMAKTRFLANMSHELRTPLNAILGFSEVLSGEMFGPLGAPAYRGYAADIESSGKRLLAIISDLLDMSRIQLDEFQLEPEPLGLAALVGACVNEVRATWDAEGAPIVVAPIDPAWVIDADRRALSQVVSKLLSNALKFTPPAGRISVELRQDRGDAVTLCVTDTGCGIAAERMATLFEPFQHAGADRTRSGNGAGLGLWVSRALIELHGGTLVLTSIEGKGTVAAVTLPGMRVRQRPSPQRIAS